MDIVFPVCSRTSTSAGTGSDCSINIAYNRQVPVCTGLNADYTNNGNVNSQTLKCRGYQQLCYADANFEFAFSNLQTVSLSAIFGSSPDMLLHVPDQPLIQLPIRPGDYNIDGFPDLLFVTSQSGTRASLVESVPCDKGIAGCNGSEKRGWKVGKGKGWGILDEMTDVTGASWVDIDDDVRREQATRLARTDGRDH